MRSVNAIGFGITLLVALTMAGCSGAAPPAVFTAGTPAPASVGSAAATPAAPEGYASAALPASYDDALPASTQLALGILRLEGAPQAVTPAQAKALLPLWQAFQGNALRNDAERNAVLKQIEGSLTAEQVKAIAAMQLTNDDMRKWMEEHGMRGGSPGALPGTPGPGGGPPDMTDEQRQAFRATVEAGGGPPDLGNMTEEQRQAFRATVEAGGGQFFQRGQGGQGPGPRGTPGAGGRNQLRFFAPYRIFVEPLVELLTARAAE